MLNYLIACRSLTYAQRAARTLERNGITAAVIRMPRELSEASCAYAVRVSERKLAAAQQALLTRLSSLEMGMPGATNQSREARSVRLAPWMGLKK